MRPSRLRSKRCSNRHRGFYGAPRVQQELRAAGLQVGRHRVARLMRRAVLKAQTRRGFRPCRNSSGRAAGVAENLLQQDFSPLAPNRCWAGDITYLRTTAGWRYLAVWIDLYSRRVIGWAMGVRPAPDPHRSGEPNTGRRPTGNCWRTTRSVAACQPRAAAGTTQW